MLKYSLKSFASSSSNTVEIDKNRKKQERLLWAFRVIANTIRTKTNAASRNKKLKVKETFEMGKRYIHWYCEITKIKLLLLLSIYFVLTSIRIYNKNLYSCSFKLIQVNITKKHTKKLNVKIWNYKNYKEDKKSLSYLIFKVNKND